MTSQIGACEEQLIADFVALGTIAVPGFRLITAGRPVRRDGLIEEEDDLSTDPEIKIWIDEASEKGDFLVFLSENAKRDDLAIPVRLALIDRLHLIGTDETKARLIDIAATAQVSVVKTAPTPEQKQ